jgi:cytochrome c biogenesis protein CcmG, thiol:disulfide interchange protein DsbE
MSARVETARLLARATATAALLFTAAIVLSDLWRQRAAPRAAVGEAAPSFTLKKLSGGGSLALAQLRDRVVVLNFFASWCKPCRHEAPVLRRLSRDYSSHVVVVGVAVNDQPNSARSFAASLGLDYPLLRADEGVLSSYAIRSLPETVFIGADGMVSGRPIVGPLTYTMATERVAAALGTPS